MYNTTPPTIIIVSHAAPPTIELLHMTFPLAVNIHVFRVYF